MAKKSIPPVVKSNDEVRLTEAAKTMRLRALRLANERRRKRRSYKPREPQAQLQSVVPSDVFGAGAIRSSSLWPDCAWPRGVGRSGNRADDVPKPTP
jgi:hypothetical protein